MKIKKVSARRIFDSRENPTIEVSVVTERGLFKASVPSGASTGIYEAVEIEISRAIKNVDLVIGPEIIGMDCCEQKKIDNKMIKLDGTKNKKRLGANAIVGVSMAVCRAGASAKGLKLYEYIGKLSGFKMGLPVPSFNIINGGRHARNKLSFQEFMILPIGAKSFKEAFKMCGGVYSDLKKIIGKVKIGDEGGFAPNISSNREGLELLKRAIEKKGYGGKVKIGIDVAASEMFKKGKYDLGFKSGGRNLKNGKEMIELYEKFVEDYGIISIEDGFDQDDWKNWVKLNSKIGRSVQIVGDDLLVTNVERIKKAIKLKACNTLLLKVNQIGSVSEAIEASRLAKKAKWKVMVSHRSGETEDSFIADLAVGIGAEEIKSGAPYTCERLAKYERLLEIEKKSKLKLIKL